MIWEDETISQAQEDVQGMTKAELEAPIQEQGPLIEYRRESLHSQQEINNYET